MNKWDERFLQLAETVSTWSKDPSTKVGAVIVDETRRRVVSFGYNGFPRGMTDDEIMLADRPTRLGLTIHAELNAILNAREPLDGFTIYVTPLHPCSHCAAAIAQAGLRRVVYRQPEYAARWEESFGLAATVFDQLNIATEEM